VEVEGGTGEEFDLFFGCDGDVELLFPDEGGLFGPGMEDEKGSFDGLKCDRFFRESDPLEGCAELFIEFSEEER
jgi:hypothetical protein